MKFLNVVFILNSYDICKIDFDISTIISDTRILFFSNFLFQLFVKGI